MNSSKVSGTAYPAASKRAGWYQTSDLRSDLTGTPTWVPSTLPNTVHASDQLSAVAVAATSAKATTSPARANSASLPGCGKIEMSGGLPPATCTLMFASQLASPRYTTSTPLSAPQAPRTSWIEPASDSSRSGPVMMIASSDVSGSSPPSGTVAGAAVSPVSSVISPDGWSVTSSESSPAPPVASSAVSAGGSAVSSSLSPQAAAINEMASTGASTLIRREIIDSPLEMGGGIPPAEIFF